MPQLDFLAYSSQYFWLVIIFFSLYLTLQSSLLPAVGTIFKVRALFTEFSVSGFTALFYRCGVFFICVAPAGGTLPHLFLLGSSWVVFPLLFVSWWELFLFFCFYAFSFSVMSPIRF